MAAAATVPETTRPIPAVEGVEHRFVDVGGLRMHYAEAGPEDGEPLVMLHGWPQHWCEWRHLIGPMAERFRVIAPDLRGFGWTDAPPGGYEKENMAADIVRLWDVLGLERVRLVGHDWGGYLSFLICLRHPERVERFLALNINHPWMTFEARDMLSTGRLWYQYLVAAPGLGPWAVSHRTERVNRAIRRATLTEGAWDGGALEAFTDQLREPARARASSLLYRTFLRREFWPLVRGRYRALRLATPTLLLFGTGDFAIPVRKLAGYEPYADDMRVELVPDTGHYIADERPDLVRERALSLFDG